METLNFIRITIFWATLFLLGGCAQDKLGHTVTGGDNTKRVNVSLTLNIPAPHKTGTPSKTYALTPNTPFCVGFDSVQSQVITRSSGATKLYNLWIFQFNADGSRNGSPTKISDEITAVNDMVTLEVPLVVAENQTLYLVALGTKLETDLSTISSKNELENWEFDYTTSQGGSTKSNITSDTEIPFAGFASGVKILEIDGGKRGLVEYNTPDGFVGAISIKRLMAKISLRYKFDVPNHILEGLKMVNVNKVIRIVNPEKNDDTDSYGTLDPEFSNIDADGYITAIWYVAQNRQNDVPGIVAETDRFYKVVDGVPYGSAPPLGTFIEAWASKSNNSNNYTIYQMYIGLNTTSNFDVLANSIYNLHTTINTDIEYTTNDGRIREYSAVQNIYLVSSEILSWKGGVNRPKSGNQYSIDAHYDCRPIIIDTKGTTVSIGIYSDANCTNLVDVSQSWLKLSSSPNYTEAVNNLKEPLSTYVVTQTILPVRLKFYLYNNEYLPSSTDDLYKIEAELPKTRTLYVKAITTEVGEAGDITVSSGVFRMNQYMGIYFGAFGGEMTNGTYTDALILDFVEEAPLSYTEEPDPRTGLMPWGYADVTFPAESPVENNTYNGIEATKYLAENPDNHIVGALNVKEPRKLSNGKIDLYQYNYSNTYAARFCYDRNRDENGDGEINYLPGQTNNELKWYLPSMRQWMGYIVFTPTIGSYSSSYFWSVTVRGQYSYAGGQGGEVDSYLRTDKWPIRCVREIPFDNISVKVAPTAYVYTDERDNKYAAINASDQVRRIEDRNENPNFWKTGIGLYHYVKGGINPEPVKDKDGNNVLVTRPARSGTQNSNRTVSSHFVIASSDIDNTTVTPNNKTFNWATASGYLETANTTYYNEEASATNHGCASYRGKDNKDPEGSWRLPLVREAVLMMLYENLFRDTASETGFENLMSGLNYWTASENMATQSWQFYSMLQSNITTRWKVGPVGGWKTGLMRARCIKDIPPTP